MQARARSERSRRLERFNVVITILLAGWVPSILMLVVSYTILSDTLESKILRDRQTFVQLIARLVGDDLGRTSGIIDYYQTLPAVAKLFSAPNPATAAQQWLAVTYYSHPRIDGLFLADMDGRIIAALPYDQAMIGTDAASKFWQKGADAGTDVFVSPVHPRRPDDRLATDIVGAVRAQDGAIIGYIGASVLVERIGKRLATIGFTDQSSCQVIDQSGSALFTKDFLPNAGAEPSAAIGVPKEISADKSGHLESGGDLYSFSPVETTGWTTIVRQPKAAAYRPIHDLLGKMTLLASWLILGTGTFGWLAGRFYRRQSDAAARFEREVIFNEKILANMPSGIALIDPASRRFLQANESFDRMAHRLGQLGMDREISSASYEEVQIAPPAAIEGVLASGKAFQMIEQPFTAGGGETHFLNVNLLRLQDKQQIIQGILYLIEDKTRDVTLRQELISANAAKDQFLALLSHELRNPLSPVIAMVSELEARTPDSPEVRQALEIIRRNVELEARLIDDLLDITRISKGKLQLTFEVASVHEILQRAYEICREDILAKDLRVEFRLRAENCHVEADPARLQQVFWNLIKNAVKFTPAEGRLTIETANSTADQIEIKTIDTGIGIESDKVGRVFNAFEQGQHSITRRFGGLGLGLAISKAMVDAHGGRISVESAGKDRGSTFTVHMETVPNPTPSSAGALPKSPLPVIAQSDLPTNGKKPRVLVVDDHHDTCLGMKLLLERRGYRITLAHSATEALAKAKEAKFDLLISDIGLPDRSGYELMQEFRTLSNVRGIALSGFGMENDIAKAHEAGFSEHLTKPINFDRLEQAMQTLLSPGALPPT